MADGGNDFSLIKIDGQVLTKLIETISAGIGAVSEPWLIKRRAAAEGEADVIRARKKQELAEIAERAERRSLAQEVRRQENVEAVVQQAASLLSSQPEPPSPEPVNPDWTARMLSNAEEVSDEAMRSLWARILAGEVTRPGTFSLRSLETVRNMSVSEAAAFNTLCAVGLRSGPNLYPMLFNTQSPALRELNLHFTMITELETMGLLKFQPLSGFNAEQVGLSVILTLSDGREIGLRRTTPAPLRLGHVLLTSTGQQLAPLAVGQPSAAHVRDVAHALRADGWLVHYLTRDPGTGQVAMEFPIDR